MIDLSLIDELTQTPMGQTLIEQRAERARARRAELVARRREAQRERERLGVKHAKAIAVQQQARDAAQQKLRDATDAFVAAEQASTAATAPLDAEIGRIECELAATVDARLTAAINALTAVDRSEWVICRVGRDGLNRPTARTNVGAVRRLSEAHALALAALRALAYEAPDDLDAAIATALTPYQAALAARGVLDTPEPARPAARRPPAPALVSFAGPVV
jgi:hypothetical protein